MSSLVKNLVIPAAGMGTRMQTLTAGAPKEALSIGKRPVIQYAVAEGMAAGIERVILILRHGKESLANMVADMGVEVIVCYQVTPRGEMDALSLAEPYASGAPLAVIYPDNVIFDPAGPRALKSLVDAYRIHRTDLTALISVTEEDSLAWSNSGRVELDSLEENLYRIRHFIPKGSGCFVPRFPSELRSIGMWIVGGHIFDVIRQVRPTIEEQSEFTDVPVREQLVTGAGMLGVSIHGKAFDVGNPEGYCRCQATWVGCYNEK